MTKPRNLLDLMTPEDREKAIAKGRKRLEKKQRGSIPPEMYLIAEFASYYGWEGVLAIKRGYIEARDNKGEIIKVPFTLEEVSALRDASQKVWYSQLVETAKANLVATRSAFNKNPNGAFNTGMQQFRDKAK